MALHSVAQLSRIFKGSQRAELGDPEDVLFSLYWFWPWVRRKQGILNSPVGDDFNPSICWWCFSVSSNLHFAGFSRL